MSVKVLGRPCSDRGPAILDPLRTNHTPPGMASALNRDVSPDSSETFRRCFMKQPPTGMALGLTPQLHGGARVADGSGGSGSPHAICV